MSDLVYLPVSQLYPHPDNPRKNVDDLEELAASIKANGVLQNLTVVLRTEPIKTSEDARMAEVNMQAEQNLYLQKIKMHLIDKGYRAIGGYTVIIGHRRLAAAKLAGLEEVPCTVAEMSPKEQVQTMLLENMQRKDLKVYEEAQGFQMLLDFGDSVDEVSEKSGFSTTTIRRRVKLTELDQAKLKEAVDARPIPLGDFELLSALDDVGERNSLLEFIGTSDFRWKLNGALNRQAMNKNLPEVKAWLKANHINKLPEGKSYSSEYTSLGDWNDFDLKDWGAALKKIPKLKPGKKYFYSISDYNCQLKIYLYEPAERTKRSPEEIEEEKRIARAWEYLDKQAAEMYERRKAFIEQLTVTKKNESAILNGAILRTMAASFHYIYFESSKLYPMLGVTYDVGASDNYEKLFAAFWKSKKDNLAKLVYMMWADSEKYSPTSSGFRRAWPEWSINRILTPLYEWLVSLGYEMTDNEKDLMTGKAKIYEKDSEIPEAPEAVPAPEAGGDTEDEPGEV